MTILFNENLGITNIHSLSIKLKFWLLHC